MLYVFALSSAKGMQCTPLHPHTFFSPWINEPSSSLPLTGVFNDAALQTSRGRRVAPRKEDPLTAFSWALIRHGSNKQYSKEPNLSAWFLLCAELERGNSCRMRFKMLCEYWWGAEPSQTPPASKTGPETRNVILQNTLTDAPVRLLLGNILFSFLDMNVVEHVGNCYPSFRMHVSQLQLHIYFFIFL